MKLANKLILSVIVLTSFLMLTLPSCTKDAPAAAATPAPLDLSGTTWRDSAIVNGITYKPYTMTFALDGTGTETFSGFPAFPGTWSKTPNSNTVYFYFVENASTTWKGQGNLSAGNTIITGTLTRLTPSALSGTFRVIKQ